MDLLCGPDCGQPSSISRKAKARVKVQKSLRGGVQAERAPRGLIQEAITDH